jgi:hypothetical protein
MAQPVWNTPTGTLGTVPALTQIIPIQLSASAVLPATTVSYSIISGNLPTGLTMTSSGLITGVPPVASFNTTYPFVIRATDNFQNIKDITLNIVVSGAVAPSFAAPSGSLYTTNDSTWLEFPVSYNNPISTNKVIITVVEGSLPPGLEINEAGIIRGYAQPPVIDVTLPPVTTGVVAISNNTLICLSTAGFSVGRPIIFTGSVLGGLGTGQIYYISSIIDQSTFTISYSVGGQNAILTDSVGYMTATLSPITQGAPTIQTYSFILKLDSLLGNAIQTYSITVINQNTPVSQGGLGLGPNSRKPAIFNTRPETFNITKNPQEFGYYILPPNSNGNTYAPTDYAYITQFASSDFVAFKVLGHDFDGNQLTYLYSNLPLGLTGDPVTGWITGTPVIANNSIGVFSFSVSVVKSNNTNISSGTFNFSMNISNAINGNITWITDSNLGQVNNGTVSILNLVATCDVPLSYRFVSGSLPPNLNILSSGDIIGDIPYQPTDMLLTQGETTTFVFTAEAYSPQYPVINSQQTFTLTVYQEYVYPTDTLYIKCTPSLSDRSLINSLLTNASLIPPSMLYRSDDPNFGVATDVIYEHAYGINASNMDQYIAAVTENHYWKNITLGEIETAVARDSNGNIIYEVVYSRVIDNLVSPSGVNQNYSNYNTYSQTNYVTPYGTSVSKQVQWPFPIPLNLGPWYSSEVDIFSSYIGGTNTMDGTISQTFSANGAITCDSTQGLNVNDYIIFNGTPFGGVNTNTTYYILSILNSTQFIISMSEDGTPVTLTDATGNMSFVAWTDPKDYYTSLTPGYAQNLYPNSLPNMRQQVEDVLGDQNVIGILPDWMSSQQLDGSTLGFTPAWVIAYCLPGTITLPNGITGSYAQYIQYQIQNSWTNTVGELITLNTINFKIDRFSVNKSTTYNYDSNVTPSAWTGLPSATPTPNPVDSDDFYVLFPQETILPNKTQLNL